MLVRLVCSLRPGPLHHLCVQEAVIVLAWCGVERTEGSAGMDVLSRVVVAPPKMRAE